MDIKRRSFLTGLAAAGAACMVPTKKAEATTDDNSYATLIDLTKCNGCPDRGTPACVAACRTENADRFPEPDPAMLKDYWPQKKHEDWSKKRDLTSRLTPYNWIFVQHAKVEVDGKTEEVTIPRRCMHCDNPPCVKMCPFGAKNKAKEGPVYINENLCMGGAKCRTVCPWDVPQRQAGVGIYTYMDPMPVGGGSMFKCDLCRHRLEKGQKPACVEACPRGAMKIGTRKEIYAKAEKLRKRYNGYIYGDKQNGGTSTLYVSKVPFDAIDKALVAQAREPKKVMRLGETENMLEDHSEKAIMALTAPVLGAIGAFAATVAKQEKKKDEPQPPATFPDEPEAVAEKGGAE